MSDTTPVPNESQRAGQEKPKRERKTPFAISQAQRDIEAAEREVEAAKESGSKSRIDAAEKDLTKKREVLADLRKGPKSERREARREQADEYYDRLGPYIVGLVKNVPELREAVQEAIADGWSSDKFLRDRRVVDWLATKGTAAKQAIQTEFDPTKKKEWEDLLADAKNKVRDVARQQYNIDITDVQLDRLARKYIYEGWETNPRGLQVWMSERLDRGGERTQRLTGGTVEQNERDLRALARGYGLIKPDTEEKSWFRERAEDLLDPRSGVTRDMLIADMIREAESTYPVFAGKLSETNTVRDAAASYIGWASRYLEVDPDQLELDDPLLNRAFTGEMDEKSNPKLMSLWDFQKAVRQDDRWQTTENAVTTYTDFGERLLKMFGIRG